MIESTPKKFVLYKVHKLRAAGLHGEELNEMNRPVHRKNRFRKRIALRVARRGWPVLPLHCIREDRCSCGRPDCSSPGKHPMTPHGIKDASTEEAEIVKWFTTWPDANIGIVTGRQSGITVVDIDLRHGGLHSLQQLREKYGRFPNGPAVRTGGGGLHLYFGSPSGGAKSKVGLFPGIDIRSEGSYVVGAGSIHQSGKSYLYLHGRTPEKVNLPHLPRWIQDLISSEPEHLATARIQEGLRNSTLTSIAGTMRSRGMSYEAIEAALLEDNLRRCNPPLPEAEVLGIARSISRYAPGDSNILSAASYQTEEAERKLLFRTGKEIADEAPADVPWIARPWVASGAITEVDGKVKQAGKTTFLTHLVRAALDGADFLAQPTTKTKTVYLTEQALTTFRMAMERANLLGRRDFTVLTWTDTLGVPWPSVVKAAVNECKRRVAKLLVIDTLPQFAGLPGDSENLAGNALEALKPLQLAAAEGLAIVIVRHERKSGGSVGDSGRGSSAFAGAVDIVLSVRKPEGNQPRNIRLLQTISRLSGHDDLLVELTENGYRALGSPGNAAKEQAAAQVLAEIPESQEDAATIQELAEATGRKRAHLQRLLDSLMEKEQVLRLGKGRKNDPYRYYRE